MQSHQSQSLQQDPYVTCDLAYHFSYLLLYGLLVLGAYDVFGWISIAIAIAVQLLVINLEVPLLQHFLCVDIRYDKGDLAYLALDEPLLDLSKNGIQEGGNLLVRRHEYKQTEMLGRRKHLRRIYSSLIEYTVDPVDYNEGDMRKREVTGIVRVVMYVLRQLLTKILLDHLGGALQSNALGFLLHFRHDSNCNFA